MSSKKMHNPPNRREGGWGEGLFLPILQETPIKPKRSEVGIFPLLEPVARCVSVERNPAALMLRRSICAANGKSFFYFVRNRKTKYKDKYHEVVFIIIFILLLGEKCLERFPQQFQILKFGIVPWVGRFVPICGKICPMGGKILLTKCFNFFA